MIERNLEKGIAGRKQTGSYGMVRGLAGIERSGVMDDVLRIGRSVILRNVQGWTFSIPV